LTEQDRTERTDTFVRRAPWFSQPWESVVDQSGRDLSSAAPCDGPSVRWESSSVPGFRSVVSASMRRPCAEYGSFLPWSTVESIGDVIVDVQLRPQIRQYEPSRHHCTCGFLAAQFPRNRVDGSAIDRSGAGSSSSLFPGVYRVYALGCARKDCHGVKRMRWSDDGEPARSCRSCTPAHRL
jgi:hypothetical protein